ncbi:hypothetical protein HY612_03410 [Candidatus Roizmanbacteria bacterium]|nr:hypothetical protein [Candidatus Roizmanbacteria bacterium]
MTYITTETKATHNFLSLKGTIKTKRKYADNKADRKVKEFIKKSDK